MRKTAYLDELVPTGGDNHGVGGVGAEADTGDPVGVALVGDGVLAVTEGVPELDAAVARTGDDLAVVGGERDGEDIVGVADETTGGLASGELPEAEGLVPRRGKSVGTIGGDDLFIQLEVIVARGIGVVYTVGDDVGVTLKRALGDTVARLVTGTVFVRQYSN